MIDEGVVEIGSSNAPEAKGLGRQYEEVANIIGSADIDAHRVSRLHQAMERQGVIAHGVRRLEFVDKVKAKGVSPLTPEGGMVSFWNQGIDIFISGDNPKSWGATLNSTFFNWGHSRGGDESRQVMTIAFAKRGDLEEAENFLVSGGRGEVTVKPDVTPEFMHVLQVEVSRDPNLDARQQAQQAERAMFLAMEDVFITDRFTPGRWESLSMNSGVLEAQD